MVFNGCGSLHWNKGREKYLGGVDKFPNRSDGMRIGKEISAASGVGKAKAAHFSPGFVPAHSIELAQRRSLRLASRKMDSPRAVCQFVHTAQERGELWGEPFSGPSKF
jgi:hypothetical protein